MVSLRKNAGNNDELNDDRDNENVNAACDVAMK